MLLSSLTVPRDEFEDKTGWQLKPEGACKGDVCIPLGDVPGDTVDVAALAEKMGLPLAAEPAAGLWALGPESLGGRALTTAEAPDFELPDLDGNRFRLSSQKGKKIVVFAWAPY